MHPCIKNNRIVRKLHAFVVRFFGGNRFRGLRGNTVRLDGVLRHTVVELRGKGNTVICEEPQYVNHLRIFINGNNNVIEIAKNCLIRDLTLWMEDNNGHIRIGENALFCGTCQLSVIEGTEIAVGKDCLFSSGVNIRTGDSHSILDAGGGGDGSTTLKTCGSAITFGSVRMLRF